MINGALKRYLPFLDLKDYETQSFKDDLTASLSVTLLAVPQGVAYALIAGLPAAMGLYAATLPTIIGSLFRSSRHVVTGPTNAVSLLVGTAVAAHVGTDPASIAITLALMVGLVQLLAGFLQLGSLVYYISSPVVLGYITGAGVLIGVGQLGNITNTGKESGHLFHQLGTWIEGLGGTDPIAVAMAAGTAIAILGIKRIHNRLPAAIIAMAGAIGVNILFALESKGLRIVGDLSQISGGFPTLHLPDLSLIPALIPVAIAVSVLSLVESTSIARSIANHSGQRLDLSVEFTGEGLSNLASSLVGGYPTTGSLSRSALNRREGASSRLAGVFSGVLVLLAILTLGPLLNRTPIASLAGLLLVVAWGLIDRAHIKTVIRSHNGDRMAFLATVAGTFVLHLDQAIYLGVGISLILFLRRARLLSIRDLVVDEGGRLREVSSRTRQEKDGQFHQPGVHYCRSVHVMNVAGSMFFGAAGELQNGLDIILRRPEIKVLVLRLKRAQSLDVTTVEVLINFARQMRIEDRHVFLVGMPGGVKRYFERVGASTEIGQQNIFPARPDHWFAAMEDALTQAFEIVGEHPCEAPCALRTWVNNRDVT